MKVIDTLVSFLHQYQQEVILISPPQHENLAARLQEKLENIYTDYEDNYSISDLDKKSQNQILERNVNFQGTNSAMQTLVGTDPPECIKHLDSDVIAIMLINEHKLCRQTPEQPFQVLCKASTATSHISKGRHFEADRQHNYIRRLRFKGG
jgi:hypothetical protein